MMKHDTKKAHPLGKYTPWVWVLEPVHGCNLRCGQRSCRLNEPGKYHLDWEAAKKFGLFPVVDPPKRRCNQPFRYVPVDSMGNYLLCCQDNTGETSGMFGNVRTGKEGFLDFWLGNLMQKYRINLINKNRAGNPQCSRCCITFSRCDYKHWTNDQLKRYWKDGKWNDMK